MLSEAISISCSCQPDVSFSVMLRNTGKMKLLKSELTFRNKDFPFGIFGYERTVSVAEVFNESTQQIRL